MNSIFLIAPPGLEEVVACELRSRLPAALASDPKIQTEKGGVSLELPLETALALNRSMKTPSRILVRLMDFRCRDFPKLYKKFRGYDWSQWFPAGTDVVEFDVSSRQSRLAIKRRIEDVCQDGFAAWRKSKAQAKGSAPSLPLEPPRIFVRFVDDVCTVSLDSSGEHLHKRGYRWATPEAPIRETLAAALLMKLFDRAATDERGWTVVDPMAGSGTFLFEAVLLDRPAERPFAFESFVSFASNQSADRGTAGRAPVPKLVRFEGWDTASVSLNAARVNSERIRAQVGSDSEILFFERDAFEAGDALYADRSRGPLAVICNPPYGERLKVEGPLSAYYERLLAAIERSLRPELAGFVLPAKARPENLRVPSGWRRLSFTRFENGGIPVVFCVWGR